MKYSAAHVLKLSRKAVLSSLKTAKRAKKAYVTPVLKMSKKSYKKASAVFSNFAKKYAKRSAKALAPISQRLESEFAWIASALARPVSQGLASLTIISLLAVSIAPAISSFPQTAIAAGNLSTAIESITISDEFGNSYSGPDFPGFTCEENPLFGAITVSGTGSGAAPPGSIEQYGVQVDWGDGTIVGAIPPGAGVFTPPSGNQGSFTVTFDESHTYAADGAFPLSVLIYHQNPNGNDNPDAASVEVELCVQEEPPAILTLEKEVIKDNGGTAVDTDWTLSATGPTNISGVEGDASITSATVGAGTYTLSESGGPEGYTASAWSCTGTTVTNGNEITLAAEDNAVCTITNNDNAPTTGTLVVTKNTTGGDGTFEFSGAGSFSVTTVSGTGSETINDLIPGSYTISESEQEGWEEVSNDCAAVSVVAGQTANCTIENHKNQIPIITITGDNPLELVVNVDSYVELGATADDVEDGDNLVVTNINSAAVNTGVVGSYSVFYNFIDSDGAAAEQKIRTVNVILGGNQCNDSIDNDGDGDIDYPADEGCDSINDPSENEPPVITLSGNDPLVVTLGNSYVELGATADDAEDGENLVVTDIDSSSVNTGVEGSYSVTYDFTDSDGVAAAQEIREVQVKAACSDGIDNDNDDLTDQNDPGCHSDGDVQNSGSYVPSDNDESDVIQQFTLDLALIGDGEGFIGSGDEMIACDSNPAEGEESELNDCVETYAAGTIVELTVSPDEGSNFDSSWTAGAGTCTGNNTSCQITMNQNVSLTAHFALNPVTPPPSNGGGGGGGGGSSGSCSAGFTFNPITLNCDPSGQVLGASTGPTGEVLGAACGLTLDQHLMKGSPKNKADQVTKLQEFLNKHGFATFTPTGYFGEQTYAAVRAFQAQYTNEILTPWNIGAPTGIVYLTTIRQLNLLECPDLTLGMPELVPWNLNPNPQ